MAITRGSKLTITIGGVINIPIRMDKTAREGKISLHEYHADDMGAGGRKKVCKLCNKELTDAEIVKGFEVEKGKVVTFSKDELEGLPLSSTRSIEIALAEANEVSPTLHDTDYYLTPDGDEAAKPFNLFADSLKKMKKVAVGKVTIKQRENLCVIRPVGGTLVLSTLFWNDEIKDVPQVPKTKTTATELDLMSQYLGTLVKPFNHADYSDNYNDVLNKMAQDKLAGKKIVVAINAPKAQPQNLEDVLRQAIAKAPKKK